MLTNCILYRRPEQGTLFSPILVSSLLTLGILFTPLLMEAKPPAPPVGDPPTLEHAQKLSLEVVALTERGVQDSTELHDTLKSRLMEVGYDIVSTDTPTANVRVRLKCEERKRWSGPSKYRVGTHTGVETSRLWKGPACQISYRHPKITSTWSREIHTPFEEAETAARKAGVKKVGQYALQQLNAQLQVDPFPLHLAAEWGQAERLVQILQQSTTNETTKRLIVELLGPLDHPLAFSTLEESVSQPALAVTALRSLGHQGERAIPALASVLKESKDEAQRLAAIESLGEIATHNKTPSLFDHFVPLLNEPNHRIQTIAVKSLGRLGDQRAIPPLEELNLKTWTNTSTDADIKELREALNWSLWQLNPDAHTGE